MKAMSLFASGGIGETYLERCGVHTVVANEFVEARAKCHHERFPHANMIAGDIREKKDELIRLGKEAGVKLLIATPPCQGMSMLGSKNYCGDKRNFLIFEVIDIIHGLNPDYILIENVPKFLQMTYPKDRSKFHEFMDAGNSIHQQKKEIRKKKREGNADNENKELEEENSSLSQMLSEIETISTLELLEQEFGDEYNIKSGVYNAADYGVPQRRMRAFIRIYKKELSWEDPKKAEKQMTVRDAIGHLPSIESGESAVERYKDNPEILAIPGIRRHVATNITERHIEMMHHTPTGCSAYDNKVYYPKRADGKRVRGYHSTYSRIKWDAPCPTRTMTSSNIGGSNNGHPGRLGEWCSPEDAKDEMKRYYTDARTLTLCELLLLSGIEPDAYFPEWATDRFMRDLIGEGVPPKMMEAFVSMITKNEKEDLDMKEQENGAIAEDMAKETEAEVKWEDFTDFADFTDSSDAGKTADGSLEEPQEAKEKELADEKREKALPMKDEPLAVKKHRHFLRESELMVRNAISAIWDVEKCAEREQNQYSKEEVDKMFSAIQRAVDEAKSKFQEKKNFSWD